MKYWKKVDWKKETAYIQLKCRPKYYCIMRNEFTHGINNHTWFDHLSEKGWITVDIAKELLEVFKESYPDIDWDKHYNKARREIIRTELAMISEKKRLKQIGLGADCLLFDIASTEIIRQIKSDYQA